MYTEDEAKQKWCPFARYAMKDKRGLLRWATAINRWFSEDDKQHNPERARCIASDCMAWRWGKNATKTLQLPRKDWLGFCGLAGKGE